MAIDSILEIHKSKLFENHKKLKSNKTHSSSNKYNKRIKSINHKDYRPKLN